MSKSHVHYLSANGSFPANIGFCPDWRAFKREWKDLTDNPIPEIHCDKGGARCWSFDKPKDGRYPTYLICIELTDKLSWHHIAAMIAHEAVHVGQFLWEQIGEEAPGREVEAYLVQYITQEILQIMGIPDRRKGDA